MHVSARGLTTSAIPYGAQGPRAPILAEDLLLLLFLPNAGGRVGGGTIAGEGTLSYSLAGAVLADLGLGAHVRTLSARAGTTRVEATAEHPPSDGILRTAWDHLAEKPRGVQTALATIGPTLRGPLLDRLVERGDVHRTTRRRLGLFDTTVLEDGGTGRRTGLVGDVRGVLVHGVEPRPRVAALAALLSASGTLPQFHPEIPWTSAVITRAQELERGNWRAPPVRPSRAPSAPPSSAASSPPRPRDLRRERPLPAAAGSSGSAPQRRTDAMRWSMPSEWKRRRAAGRTQPGDRHALQRYRWWQSFSRSLFHLHLGGGRGVPETWSVDVRHGGDEDGHVWAELYRDGLNHARSRLPATFAVPGGTIEVVTSGFGLSRCHYVTQDGTGRQLVPDPASAEGRRARLERTYPALSRAIGLSSGTVLLVALVLGVPQIIETITLIPPISERTGTFLSPFRLPEVANIALLLATVVASTERALRLRYNWLLDGGFFGGDD